MMRGLLFPFADIVRECEVFEQLARGFLDVKTVNVLKDLKSSLEHIQTRRPTTETTRWEIKRERPLRTIWSKGEYNPKGKGEYLVQAEIAFVWEIRPVDEAPWRGKKFFALDGLASTVVRLMGRRETQDAEAQELATWKVEVGDHQSPGPHFHVQIGDYTQAPFPKSLEVPRLPGLLMTPMLVVETVLAELFQQRWERVAVAGNQHTQTWHNLHAPRLRALLEWQRTELERVRVGTTWAHYKRLRPKADLLIQRGR